MHHQTHIYHQNIRYTQLAFPLYSMKHQVQMRDLCWISCFWCFSLCLSLFRCFSWKLQCFSWKLLLFTKTAMLFTKTAMLFMKTAAFCENRNSFHCQLFGLSPSIGLSFERPTSRSVNLVFYMSEGKVIPKSNCKCLTFYQQTEDHRLKDILVLNYFSFPFLASFFFLFLELM